MKATTTSLILFLTLASGAMAQNQITTPTGQPLVIGNQGVKHATLTSASATQASNGKVLTVDANGLFILAPDVSGNSSQWSTNASNISYSTGNVGVGTTSPLQRLDVNGDINISNSNGLRIGNRQFLGANGTNNVFLGFDAGTSNTSGTNNLFIGALSGKVNTTGGNNLFIGGSSGQANMTGERNTFLGGNAGSSNTSGSFNTFLGEFAGFNSTTGINNTFLGRGAGLNNTSGGFNVYIGRSTGAGVLTGSENTFLGDNASSTLSNIVGSTAIGAGSRANCNYCMVLGRLSPQVKVGIGTSTPQTTFHVKAAGTTATGVRFENLPNRSGTVFPLFVDANGNLMKSSTAGARENLEGQGGFWSLTPDEHLLNTNSAGIIIGTGINSTPEGYKLYVSEGILTEKVKVAIQNTDDWSDKVFADTYSLRPLTEVEDFINRNKHLPDVPSASEVVKKGVDVGKMDALLLQKIEELTLYMIELKKSNDQLRKEINELKK